MVAYEIYHRDPMTGFQLVGVLPEKRKNPARITPKSIINLWKALLGNNLDTSDVFYLQVTISESTGKVERMNSPF